MNNPIEEAGFCSQVLVSIRIVLTTMAGCCILYTLVVLGSGQVLAPYSANGSLVHDDQGKIVGSEILAQGFSRREYFWPRPSAVDYNASAAGASNLSPTNPKLRARAEAIIAQFGEAPGKPVPADLVTTSGSGLDPHITLAAAKFQAERVASARRLDGATVMQLLERHAIHQGGALTSEALVNVLLVNMELDKLGK
ncbi:MAG: potassium-transporting ATPase subunit KdpC [Pseudomonadota bacterium]